MRKFTDIIRAAETILQRGGVNLIDDDGKIEAMVLLVGKQFAAENSTYNLEDLRVALKYVVDISSALPSDNDGRVDSGNGGEIHRNMPYEAALPKILPIRLIPPSERDFKAALMKRNPKRAYITIYYNNGQREVKIWNAANFSRSSNVIGNLRSRAEFRQGVWQEAGITRVVVSVEYPQGAE